MALEVATQFLEGFGESFANTLDRREKARIAAAKKRAAAFTKAVKESQKEVDTRADKLKTAKAIAKSIGRPDDKAVINFVLNDSVNLGIKSANDLITRVTGAIENNTLGQNAQTADISVAVNPNLTSSLDLPEGSTLGESGLVTFQEGVVPFGGKAVTPLDAGMQGPPTPTISLEESFEIDARASIEKPFPKNAKTSEDFNLFVQENIVKGNFTKNDETGKINYNKAKYGDDFAKSMESIEKVFNSQDINEKFGLVLDPSNKDYFDPKTETQSSAKLKLKILRAEAEKLDDDDDDDTQKQTILNAINVFEEEYLPSIKNDPSETLPLYETPSKWTENNIEGIKLELDQSNDPDKVKIKSDIQTWEKNVANNKEDKTLNYLNPNTFIEKSKVEQAALLATANEYTNKLKKDGSAFKKAKTMIEAAQLIYNENEETDSAYLEEFSKNYPTSIFNIEKLDKDNTDDLGFFISATTTELKMLKAELNKQGTSEGDKKKIQYYIDTLLSNKAIADKKLKSLTVTDPYKDINISDTTTLGTYYSAISKDIQSLLARRGPNGTLSNEELADLEKLKKTRANIRETLKSKNEEKDILKDLSANNDNYLAEINIRKARVQKDLDNLESLDTMTGVEEDKKIILEKQLELLTIAENAYQDSSPWTPVYLGTTFTTDNGDSYVGVNKVSSKQYLRQFSSNGTLIKDATTGDLFTEEEVTTLLGEDGLWVTDAKIEKISKETKKAITEENKKRSQKSAYVTNLTIALDIINEKPAVMNRFFRMGGEAIDFVNELNSVYTWLSSNNEDQDKQYTYEEALAFMSTLEQIEGRKEFAFVALAIAYGVAEGRGSTGMALSDKELKNTIASLGLGRGVPGEARVKLSNLIKSTIDVANSSSQALLNNPDTRTFLTSRADNNPLYLMSFEDLIRNQWGSSYRNEDLLETFEQALIEDKIYRFETEQNVGELLLKKGEEKGFSRTQSLNFINRIYENAIEADPSNPQDINENFTLEDYRDRTLGKLLTQLGIKFKQKRIPTINIIKKLREEPDNDVLFAKFHKFYGLDPNFFIRTRQEN